MIKTYFHVYSFCDDRGRYAILHYNDSYIRQKKGFVFCTYDLDNQSILLMVRTIMWLCLLSGAAAAHSITVDWVDQANQTYLTRVHIDQTVSPFAQLCLYTMCAGVFALGWMLAGALDARDAAS